MPNTEPLTQETAAPTQVDTNSITETTRLPCRAKEKSENAARTAKSTAPMVKRSADTKSEIVLKKLKSPKGVTIEALMEVTGWQAHSVRGFLSSTVKKKLGPSLTSEIGKDGARRYRIASNVAAD